MEVGGFWGVECPKLKPYSRGQALGLRGVEFSACRGMLAFLWDDMGFAKVQG